MIKILQANKQLMDYNKELTAVNLKNRLLGIDEIKRFILQEFKTHNQKLSPSLELNMPKVPAIDIPPP
ncbi:hypothetical protein [Algoriphagus aquimarinus]|uniref:hypothetical protein n=1 Tax=Algoriphagus aquimarinus TaxID=237018 RepID=UPI0030DB0A99|tara:strand:+ start:345 stop:548 length:204 start_codon:yes stop_codon:yes gene_type:complete